MFACAVLLCAALVRGTMESLQHIDHLGVHLKVNELEPESKIFHLHNTYQLTCPEIVHCMLYAFDQSSTQS